MLQDMIHLDHLQIDDVSSPLSAQILEFCDPEFLETFQNSEVTSSSYEDNSSYYTNNNFSLLENSDHNFNNISQENYYQYGNNNNSTTTHSTTTTTTTSTTTTAAANNPNNINNFSLLFDPQDDLDNEISASIDFSSPHNFMTGTGQQDQFDFSSLEPQLSITDMVSSQFPADHHNSVNPMMMPPLTSVFQEDCLSSVPASYVPLNPSSPSACSYFGLNNYLSNSAVGNMICTGMSADNSGIFRAASGRLFGTEWQHQDHVEFQGDNAGIFCHDSIPRVFNPGELQALSNENHQFVTNSAPLATDISCLEDPAFKVGKLSVEQRREKIHRYMKKRNQRNFTKKIKYACRKTLADSRPRVRGRFAKNDELFGETINNRAASSNHDEDDEDEAVVKEEEEMVDSADIFAHISGVNSFNCNFSIQSWI